VPKITPKMGKLGVRKRQKSTHPAYRMPKNRPPEVCMPNSESLMEALDITLEKSVA